MARFAARRLAALAITLLAISFAAFLVPQLAPGDPALMVLRSRSADLGADPATVEALRRQLGLDQPLILQYWIWLKDALRGEFGFSYTSREPVAAEVARAAVVSMTLAMLALCLALAVSLPLGVFAAMKPGGRADNAATALTQSFVALPDFWLAPMGILVFALWLGWLPSAGWDNWSARILPAVVLSLRPMAYFTRVTRAAMIDVLEAPYITAALARGLSLKETILRHGLRNGAVPVVTLFALWLAGLIGGSVVIEVIFAIPGMGRLTYEAVVNKDIPVLHAAFIATVALSVIISSAADLIYAALNPVMRHDHGAH